MVAWLPLMDRPRPATAGAERWLAFADGFYEIWEADRWRLARRAMAGLVLAGVVLGVFRLNFDDDIRKLQALSRPLSRAAAADLQPDRLQHGRAIFVDPCPR